MFSTVLAHKAIALQEGRVRTATRSGEKARHSGENFLIVGLQSRFVRYGSTERVERTPSHVRVFSQSPCVTTMSRFYFYGFLSFGVWTIIAVILHFVSASPWGGPSVLHPMSMIPDALLVELGLLGCLCLGLGGIDALMRKPSIQWVWRGFSLFLFCLYSFFGEIDREVARFFGQHLNLSYARTYIGAQGDAGTREAYMSSQPWSSIALLLAALLIIPAVYTWIKARRNPKPIPWKYAFSAFLISVLFVSSNAVLINNMARWHRIRPGILAIVYEGYREIAGLDKPSNPDRATADLIAIIDGDPQLQHTTETPPAAPHYPLWRADNLGHTPVDQFASLPLEDRPNVVLIVYETWRGWNTGLVPIEGYEEGSTRVNKILRGNAAIFPYTHSLGYPSVEGCMGIHLGIWGHPLGIFLNDYVHIRTRSFSEILHSAGYTSYALVGLDPVIDGFTPWLNRWYDEWIYDKTIENDEELVARFIQEYEARVNNDPAMMTLWTRSTHPPYEVPLKEGTKRAEGMDSKYLQALKYSDIHVAHVLEYLQKRPDWDRTVVIMVGDHAQPTPLQWRMPETIGPLTPGHTWTTLAILGGWKGTPSPGLYDFDVTHLDIAPTLLSMLDIRAHNHFMGRDLEKVVEASESPDPAVRKRVTHAAIQAFRLGDIAWQEYDERLHFRLDSQGVLTLHFDRNDPIQYGQLNADSVTTDNQIPDNWPVERWRDAIRAYKSIIEQNRFMPPDAPL